MRKYIIPLMLFLGVIGLIVENFTESYSAVSLKSEASSAITNPEVNSDELSQKIQAYSEQHTIMPIDAKIDRVWKAIPGYNGLSVNVKASYKKMKASGSFDDSKIVYKEVSPNVHLDDLGFEPIYRGNPQKPMVALLINVAWGNEYIPQILEILNDYEVKATFFLDGSWVEKNSDLARKINKNGHEIGNHAYSHPDLKKLSKADMMEELTKTSEVIEATLGKQTKWFAPPSGSFNQQAINVAAQLNMKTILWTVDTVDWKNPTPTEMVNRVITGVENGSMVLMHPTKPVAQGLDSMIEGIKSKGYQLGTVSDLMSEKRIDFK